MRCKCFCLPQTNRDMVPAAEKESFMREIAVCMKTRWLQISVYAVAALALLVTTPAAKAQNENNGEDRGVVTDSSGAVVPDVAVALANVGTGVTQTTKTDSVGVYDFPFVPLGNYKLTYTKNGFTSLTQSGVSAHIGTTVANATLQVGQVTTQVSVQADIAQVQTE